MKKTQMAKMDIPKQLAPQGKVAKEAIRAVLHDGGNTDNHLKWNSLNYAGIAGTASFIALNVLTGFEALFLTLSIIAGVVTAGSLLVSSIVFLCFGNKSLRYFNSHMREINAPIGSNELESRVSRYNLDNSPTYKTKQGFRIKQKTRKFIRPHFFLPFRIFRRILISETTWYNPVEDVYLKKSVYLKANNVIRETETYVGTRYSFRKALESI